MQNMDSVTCSRKGLPNTCIQQTTFVNLFCVPYYRLIFLIQFVLSIKLSSTCTILSTYMVRAVLPSNTFTNPTIELLPPSHGL